MRSKQVPEIIKITKTTKTWNPMKTTVFTVFLRGWDITNQLIFQSKIIKNHACNPNMLFDTPNHRKYQKVTQNGLQWGTQNPSKIIENPFWHPPGSPWVHLCPTWSPKWSPRTSKWTQNGFLGTQKTWLIHEPGKEHFFLFKCHAMPSNDAQMLTNPMLNWV